MEDRLEENELEDMIRDVDVEAFVQAHTDVKTLLYVSSTKFTQLPIVLSLIDLKATN